MRRGPDAPGRIHQSQCTAASRTQGCGSPLGDRDRRYRSFRWRHGGNPLVLFWEPSDFSSLADRANKCSSVLREKQPFSDLTQDLENTASVLNSAGERAKEEQKQKSPPATKKAEELLNEADARLETDAAAVCAPPTALFL